MSVADHHRSNGLLLVYAVPYVPVGIMTKVSGLEACTVAVDAIRMVCASA